MATMSSSPSRMAWRAVAMSEMRAAWKHRQLTSRLKAPTGLQPGRDADAMPGMLSTASADLGIHAPVDGIEKIEYARCARISRAISTHFLEV